MKSLIFFLISFSCFAAGPVWNTSKQISKGSYFNLDVSNLSKQGWGGYQILEAEIHNPSASSVTFFLSLSDAASVDYWTKLNFKTTLAPGKNIVSFPLEQFVGESGSHRFNRPLDLKSVRGWFVYVESDKDASVTIKSFKLLKNNTNAIPSDVYFFDFTTENSPVTSSALRVTEKEIFQNDSKFGFTSNTKFWRSEDSIHAPSGLRGTITVLNGTFRVKLPNGQYNYQLIWDRLGYWDPSFWKKRSLAINGEMAVLETRTGDQYLSDLLSFSDMKLNPDTVYKDLLNQCFPAKQGSFKVQNGVADFHFEGNETGAALNRLIIWPSGPASSARSFLEQLSVSDESEWQRITRLIKPSFNQSPPAVGIVPMRAKLPLFSASKPSSKIDLSSSRDSNVSTLIQFPSGDMSWELSILKSSAGGSLKLDSDVYEVLPQFTSGDMNHETFELVPKLLKKRIGRTQVSGPGIHYLLFDFNVPANTRPGRYTGELRLKLNALEHKFPFSLLVKEYKLPEVDISVGFFGLTNLPPNYFGGSYLEDYYKKISASALELLSRNGFTAFSGLPDPRKNEFAELIKLARKFGMKTIYSYGGNFSAALNEGLSSSQLTSLGQYTKSGVTPQIVHTFSDEAEGYQSRLAADLEVLKKLKRQYPSLKLSAFGRMENEEAENLYRELDVGFYTKADDWKLGLWAKKGHEWGAYNGAVGNFADPRFSFGVGLYLAARKGLKHYLEWQSVNNYPYFEMDGRETDIAAWLPQLNGEVIPTIRFKLASEGLLVYRKLKVIEANSKSDPALVKWLEALESRYRVFQAPRLLSSGNYQHEAFVTELESKLN